MARNLLERQCTSVQQVAAGVGYQDVTFFRRVFKRHTGMTPSDYRNRFGPLNVDRGALSHD